VKGLAEEVSSKLPSTMIANKLSTGWVKPSASTTGMDSLKRQRYREMERSTTHRKYRLTTLNLQRLAVAGIFVCHFRPGAIGRGVSGQIFINV